AFRQAYGIVDRRSAERDAFQLSFVEARQNGDAKDEEVVASAAAKHRLAAGGMNGRHRRSECRDLGHRSLCGVRDIVNLEVDKYFLASLTELSDERRPGGA